MVKVAFSNFWYSLSFVGLAVATLFFAASVTPSLLPRPYFVQGILSGFAIAIGYGLGILGVWSWQWLEFHQPSRAWERWGKRVTSAVVAIVFVAFVWRAAQWQNSIRELVDMPPIHSAEPLLFGLIAVVLGAGLVVLVRSQIALGLWLSKRLHRVLPRRLSRLLGGILVVLLTVLVGNGVVARSLLVAADRFFSQADELTDAGIAAPEDADQTGGDRSLIEWDTIGRRGKQFLVDGPTVQSIEAITGRSAMKPIRVYVGMRTAESEQERAELALRELQRVGGFDRSVLIVATPTGTGWLDPGAVDTVEVLHHGDTAMVSAQYSYLPSWITILVDPQRARRQSKALFDSVYGHWKTLPKNQRPRLYIQGLSLGAFGSESTANLLATFEDPIAGAVWSGPPFPSSQWAEIVRNRNPDSPVWLPTFQDSALVRFTNQKNHLQTGQRWGPIRDVYIQYASDPMVWFSPDLAWSRPAWLNSPRGPDVSPELRWIPIVTFLQVAFDLPLATSVPVGHGHNYSPSSYIDAWIAVTQPKGWDAASIQNLKDSMR